MTLSGPAPGWTLPDALEVARGDVVSLVGAGGKTTVLFQLGRALTAKGWRVVTTVTTHLGRDQSDLAPHHVVRQGTEDVGPELRAALDRWSMVLVTGRPVEDGHRWGGVDPEWVAEAARMPGVDAMLVEADGARGLSLKAPAAYEPVIPACTTLLVPMAAVDAVGRPLTEAAHRPEQVARLTALEPSDRVTPRAVATVLSAPQGALKGRPAGARVRVVINKVESPAELATGRAIAEGVLAAASPEAEAIEAVILGAARTMRPVREVRRRVAPIVLAAGQSLRMAGATPKLLLPWDGMPVIRRVVETPAGCRGLVGPPRVVVGAHADEVTQALDGTGARIIHNPDYVDGEMLSSLQVGVRSLGDGISACVVLLGDQPWLACEVVEAVLAGYAGRAVGLVAPAHGGRRGHPVLIDRRYWAELLALPRGSAPRDLLAHQQDKVLTVPVETDAILRDMDTWEDYQQALAAWRQ
jgi:molybdenum cofactor cytidylyltransferase